MTHPHDENSVGRAEQPELTSAHVQRAGDATLATRSSPFVPDWLVNLAALGWRVLAIGALVVMLWLVASVLWTVTASIAVAVVIGAFLAPFAVRLRHRGRSPSVAAGIVWVVGLAIVVGALVLLAVALAPYLAALAADLGAGIDKMQSAAGSSLAPEVTGSMRGAVSALGDASGDAVASIAGSAASAVTIVILAVFLVFFFLKDGDRAWLWMFQALGEDKRDRITEAGSDALWRVGGYLRGTTVLSAIIAVTDYAFMWLLGVPLALPLAVIVFFSGYIPYFGGAVATLLVLLVTYGAVGSTGTIVMLVLIGIRTAILSYGVRPIVYGRTVDIHPALVLIALPAGFQLAGIVGLFAAVPVTAIILAVASATVAILDPGPRPELPALVPSWLDRVAQWSWRILVALGLVALLVGVFVAMPLVVIPLLLAAIIAATAVPLVSRLVEGGRSRGGAAGIAVGGGFLAIVAIVLFALVSLVRQGAEIASTAAQGASDADAAAGGTLGVVHDAVDQGGRQLVDILATVSGDAAALFVVVILAALLAFYLIRDAGSTWARVVGRVPPDVSGDVSAAGRRAVDVLGGYMIGTGVISLVGAASQFVIMVVLGLPLALPVFVLSFFLCFIPYIGGFLSTGIAFLITVAVGSPVDIAVMAGWTILFNLVTGNVVGPLVYGKAVHLHPAVVLVAIPIGAALAGVLGMFVVVPVLGVVAATWRTVLAVVGVRRRAIHGQEPAFSEPGSGTSEVDSPMAGRGLDTLVAPDPA